LGDFAQEGAACPFGCGEDVAIGEVFFLDEAELASALRAKERMSMLVEPMRAMSASMVRCLAWRKWGL
jgi:hypothetical protein